MPGLWKPPAGEARQLLRLTFHSAWAFQLQWWQRLPPHLHGHRELVRVSLAQDSTMGWEYGWRC